MKKSLNSLKEALAYQIQGLYNAEKKLEKEIPKYLSNATDILLIEEMKKYLDSCDDKITKLERVFNYLMVEPEVKKNEVMEKLIDNTHDIVKFATSDKVRDAMLIACMQNINHHKIAGYGTCHSFAIHLNLETVTALLHDTLEWEKSTDHALTKIAVSRINDRATETEEFLPVN